MKSTLAITIKRLISEKGLKQRVVAERANFSQKEFSNMMTGRKTIVADHVPRIAEALGISPNELFKQQEEDKSA